MQMIMYAEVRKNDVWEKVDNIFSSAFIITVTCKPESANKCDIPFVLIASLIFASKRSWFARTSV